MHKKSTPQVFHLITRLQKGGAEDHMIATIQGLKEYDFTVGYGASYNQEKVNQLEENGIETRRFPFLRHYNLATMPVAVGSVATFLRSNDFDIVHTNSTEAGIVGRIAASVVGVPNIVHTVHGVPFTPDRNQLLNRFILWCERFTAERTDKIITNADIITNEYLDRHIGSEDQYTTIYSGIDIPRYQDAIPTDNLPGNRPRVVMIGRLSKGKGFELLVEAVDSIESEDFSVCIVGEGPLQSLLASQIEARGLSEKVFLTGYREDVPSILAASDVLVLPSYREGTPRVIMEAMATGIPVVATDIAGIPEQVNHEETGFLIPTGDSSILADRIKQLISNRTLRESFGTEGSRRVQQFSVDNMIEDTDQVYTELLSGGDCIRE